MTDLLLQVRAGRKLQLPAGLLFWYYILMIKSKTVVPKKTRGRPATGRDPVTAIRLSTEMRANVDRWASAQADVPGRSEAIRRLVELGLTVTTKARPRADSQKQRARELAGKAVDKMADASATDDDKANRKRRLLEGPSIVRSVRKN